MACTQRHIEKRISASKTGRVNVFRKYRNQIVSPALTPMIRKVPLPPAWLAAHADRDFSQSAFAIWWQLRVFGAGYPTRFCMSLSACLTIQQLKE